MSTSEARVDSVVWDQGQRAYRWTAVLPTRTGTGVAQTEVDAWQRIAEWHEQQPYRVVRLMPRAGIDPRAAR